MPAKKPAVPSEDRVREIAHKLWLDAGQPDGHAEAHWAQANEIAAKEGKPVAKKAPAKKAAPAKAAAPVAAPAPEKKAAPAKKATAPAKKPAKA